MGSYPMLGTKTETNGPRDTEITVTVFNNLTGGGPGGRIYAKLTLRVIVGDDDNVKAYLYIDGGPIELNLDKKALAKLVADRLEEAGKGQ